MKLCKPVMTAVFLVGGGVALVLVAGVVALIGYFLPSWAVYTLFSVMAVLVAYSCASDFCNNRRKP